MIKNLTKISKETQYNPYDSNLPKVFETIKYLINEKLPNIRIEHFGSSSIPGIGGRNNIDIVIPVEELKHKLYREKLNEIGFNDCPWKHFMPVQVGLINYSGKDYPILLYLINPNSNHFKSLIKYRDYMRNNPKEAMKYDKVKRNTIESGLIVSNKYQEAKTPYILSIIEKIK